MDQRIVPSNVEFWTRARRHLLKYGGEFVDFLPVRAEGAFLYDDAGQRWGKRSRSVCSGRRRVRAAISALAATTPKRIVTTSCTCSVVAGTAAGGRPMG